MPTTSETETIVPKKPVTLDGLLEFLPLAEDARHDGTLEQFLDSLEVKEKLGQEICNIYLRITRLRPSAYTFSRKAFFERELEFIRSSARSEKYQFQGEAILSSKSLSNGMCETKLQGCLVNFEEGLELTVNQLLVASNWGVRTKINSEEWNQVAQKKIEIAAIQSLSKFIAALNNIEIHTAYSKHSITFDPGKITLGQRFERLITDILNQHSARASLASLDEDLVEQTDIRVGYQDLERKGGARIQATLQHTHELHEQKIKTIKWPKEYVILSPWSLAVAVSQHQKEKFLEGFDLDLFWNDIGDSAFDLVSLSLALRRIFEKALKKAEFHPGGPSFFIPTSVRSLIAAYIRAEAFTTTATMRERLEWEGVGVVIRRDNNYKYGKVLQRAKKKPADNSSGTA